MTQYTRGGQKTACRRAFSSSTTWVPGTKLGSSDMVAGALRYCAISLVLSLIFERFLLLLVSVCVCAHECAYEYSRLQRLELAVSGLTQKLQEQLLL